LDASARPLHSLLQAAATEVTEVSNQSLPPITFLNIGREKTWQGPNQLSVPDSLQKFESQWPEEYLRQLKETLNKSGISQPSKVLVIDDVLGSGNSSELTSKILGWYCSNPVVEKFHFINSSKDKQQLQKYYWDYVPWKRVESRPVQSLVRDDEQISDRSTFISVPQKLSIKEQAVEYRCRLNHYFRGLYRKPNTFSSPVVQ
jgi:hypothetical protein